MNAQQQQTHPDNTISVKVTFFAENRFISLSSPASFAQLSDKIYRAFNVGQAATVQVRYTDDEGDSISVSSDDELACALALVAPGRLLRLFVDTTVMPLTPVTADIMTIEFAGVDQEASEAKPITTIIKADQEEPLTQQITGAGALMLKLAEADIIDIPEKRCARVLARFDGDVEKAAEAIQRCHERKQHRAINKPNEDQLKASAERQARHNERLAARLARQQSRSKCVDKQQEKKASELPPEVDALAAFVADKGLTAGRGKCVAALRRSGGVEAAKAALLSWSTKQQKRDHQHKVAATEAEYVAQLAKLHEMGFGDDGSGRPNAAERLRRRNRHLLTKFGGDVEQVAKHLTARKEQCQARMAERKEREQPVPAELQLLLAQLDEKGCGAKAGSENLEWTRRRNLRLLKKLDGDVERVASIIEARQARKQAKLTRHAATSAC